MALKKLVAAAMGMATLVALAIAESKPLDELKTIEKALQPALENLDLEELSAAQVHEFAFIYAPLRLKGATGSPGNPIAVR